MASSSLVLLLLSSSLLFSSVFLLLPPPDTPSFKSVRLEQPSIEVTPSALSARSTVRSAGEPSLLCERVGVSGVSRLKLGSYSSALRVTVVPSVAIPERLHGKIQVCFHRNASLGLCLCEKGEWRSIEKGVWSSMMSPYDTRFVDIKVVGDVPGSITVVIDEEPQKWRLLCLGVGFIVLLLAPFVSGWVPFYYSSSMAIGILLVIIILLFQGMKLFPTGRKSALYLTLYGSMVGAGSFLLHQFSMVVNSILANFGLSEEMHNPVSIFLVLGILIAGAALGYWMVRKFVISDDGSVDVGVAQFVKWAMRVIAATFIFQSTLDSLLALVALTCCWAICSLITSTIRWHEVHESYSFNWNSSPNWSKKNTPLHNRAEFLSKTPGKGFRSPGKGFQGKMWNRPKRSASWLDSPFKGIISSSSGESRKDKQDYYSVLHKTPNRKRFTEEEWEDSKSRWTKQAVSDLVSSPEFTDWVIEHADRIRVSSGDSSDEEVRSDTDSTDAATLNSGSRLGLFSLW